jgi:membrane-bound lytic murein transglycosylase B
VTWAGRALSRPRRRLLLAAVCGGVVVVLLDAALGFWLLADTHTTAAGSVLGPPPVAAAPSIAAAPQSVATPVGPATPMGPSVADSWVAAVSVRTGIPARALTAYANAQLATDATQPGCHMSWTLLAGIGDVESAHGSAGGATLLADGTTSTRILGPALDGSHDTVAIPATAEGRQLDGDPRWDHAIGPMQFLPSTWSHWGVSADGGIPNPNDIDDAALTAARYLCAGGRDVATAPGWQAAIASYNAPTGYAVRVTEQANVYALRSEA